MYITHYICIACVKSYYRPCIRIIDNLILLLEVGKIYSFKWLVFLININFPE